MIDPISAVASVTKEAVVESFKEAGETVLKESPLTSMMDTIENTSLEAIEAQNTFELDALKETTIDMSHLEVPYKEMSFQKDGKTETLKIPEFSDHSAAEVSISKDSYIAKDKEQFIEATKEVAKEFEKNPDQVKNNLMEQNEKIIKHDKIIFEANKKEILNAQYEMLEAKKNNNVEGVDKYLKELRHLTDKMVNIQTPKGMSFKILSKEDMLAKQIKDITNPGSKTQGRVYGFQWHHNEKPGVMQLAAKNVHEYNPHKGGNYIWGAGVR